jgi:hypothetical protein
LLYIAAVGTLLVYASLHRNIFGLFKLYYNNGIVPKRSTQPKDSTRTIFIDNILLYCYSFFKYELVPDHMDDAIVY